MKKSFIYSAIKTFTRLFSLLLLAAVAVCAQEQGRGGISSEDFAPSASIQIVQNRAKSAISANIRVKSYVQRKKVQRTAKPLAQKPKSTSAANPSPLKWEELGFTVWKLRRKNSVENSPSVSVIEKGIRIEYVPERVEADTPLKLGDKVRLTIESPRNGYLYILNSERYAGGTFGQPSLIFPTPRTRGGNNLVRAGVLIDIPAQNDEVPFFVLESKNPIYAGELLKVIISSEPLVQVANGSQGRELTPETVNAWENEWGADVDIFEQANGSGTSWTEAEKEAGQINGRALTQQDPTPQTIYRFLGDPRKPAMVNLQLPVLN